jgi:sialidase-1
VSTLMGVMLLSTFHLVPAQPLLTPAADYGRSYVATPGPGNSPAFLLESRCRIIDPAAKVTRDYYQCALCKAERTFASEDLFVVPGYDFLPVFSEGEVVVFRRGVTAGDGYREVSKPKWGGMTPRIVEGKYQVCADAEQIVTATKECGLLVGQTEIRDEASGRIAILEYPVKTMNVDVAKGVWQSDTGPVLFPDLTVPPEEWSANLKLAYIAANAPDWAEFTVEEPTPIEVGDKEVARVWHNSRSVRLSVRNQILAPAEVQLAKPPRVMEEGGLLRVRLLPPKPGNPRNSEGDFIQLKDGRILFVYTHFTGGGGDHSTAYLAGRYSSDGGRTWTAEDVTVLANEGKMNIMSVSLNRLPQGEIALFYLRKNGLEDCRPYVRFSTDEAQTWSEPIECIATPGYYVVNNDRVIQLKSGRLVMPTALHLYTDARLRPGVAMCYLSDDNGRTWYKSQSELHAPEKSGSGLQEPGVVELKDGRLMMLSRTDQGCHFRSYSSDGGVTWTEAEPTDIVAPCSPATFKRIPSTGDLLLVWNDHSQDRTLGGKRTPLTAAISRDDGVTWEHRKILEDDPEGWFCYMAMEFVGDNVLLGYCASDKGFPALAQTGIALFGVDWLYQ